MSRMQHLRRGTRPSLSGYEHLHTLPRGRRSLHTLLVCGNSDSEYIENDKLTGRDGARRLTCTLKSCRFNPTPAIH